MKSALNSAQYVRRPDMQDHLVDSEEVQKISARTEAYLHIARRIVVDQFGPEAGHDHILTIAQVAHTMAILENAEIMARAHDAMTRLLEKE